VAEIDEVKETLRTHYSKHGYLDKDMEFASAFVDLDGDGDLEALAYVRGSKMCGSGGCNLLVLVQRPRYDIISDTTISWLPVRVYMNSSRGWKNIGVRVQGGGIQPGYDVELPFNGKTYPFNPSVPPARPAPRGMAGKVVIPESAKWTPLYAH
jgi:hypothetical protein